MTAEEKETASRVEPESGGVFLDGGKVAKKVNQVVAAAIHGTREADSRHQACITKEEKQR